MKRLLLLAFIVPLISGAPGPANPALLAGDYVVKQTGTKMKLKIGNSSFTARLYDNATASAFKSLLPITVDMFELNGNEKYADLSTNLPIDALNPGTIQAGDLMLWNSNTLVLFYKTFSTSYTYTSLGRIDDVNGLAEAIGKGNVPVSFELK